MHRDPLQNVAGTSLTASIREMRFCDTESRTLDEPLGMAFPVGPKVDLRSDLAWGNEATWYSPHIDEILCQSHSFRIAGYGDRAVRCSALPLLAVADSDHGSGDLTDLGDLGTALSDDATDQLIWHGHLVRLIVRRWLLSVRVARTQLAPGQCSQCYATINCANIRKVSLRISNVAKMWKWASERSNKSEATRAKTILAN